ncbi:NO-inducible flavohemoprotein [Cohnella ginsengisoli]|uniref:Flavohemoprotein n=1 Tax=Cohnella ginsengisoli TaxID=425004 RepID=A0A9X4KP39_9BACL|nr:NO-inducible flavohemoprotein [Cohnella ginsengisoli]MDG0794979.1 NO-inducible flavohemoprotein [Cohnella ginsengisoli]
MLSSRTIEIIKSTVPVLEQHGTAITKRFYQTMFAAHPELLNLFNHANQSQGRQQTALANVVYAAALHIDKLESILPVVKQIAHKHRSLGVTADQYPIVGKYLLGAIKDVLGDAATDDILQAWAEAYGIIAKVFIGVEEGMYEEAEKQDGGWAGFRAFRVARKAAESDVVTSFYLVPADGGAVASFEPGQYISVRLDIPGETNTHIRQYSLSDAPGKPYYRISVKREDALPGKPAGKVSSYLHAQVGEGDVLHLSAPAGEFVLDRADTRPLVLISGGVGLTPMVSMLKAAAAAQPDREIAFIHAARSGDAHALRQEAEEVAASNARVSAHWCYSRPSASDRETGAFHKEGYVDLSWLQQVVPTTEASFYFCGPTPFMKTVYAALRAWGIEEERIRFEFFGPSGSLQEGQSEAETVQV